MRQLKIGKQITSRESVSLEKYLHEIGKINLITTSEEAELARKIKKGDQEATEQLVKANLRFVVSCAKQYQNQGLSLPDLINEGNLGLIKAAQKYDETRGFKFISYGVWWIRQSILQALAEQARLVRIPVNMIGSITRINKTFIRLEQDFHREPTFEEVASVLETTSVVVEDALRVSTHSISMDSPVNDVENFNLYDVILNEDSPSPDQGLMNVSLSKEIERTLSRLAQREAEVIRYFFGLNGHQALTLDEIGNEFGMSREGVRQIKEKTIRKLRTHQCNDLLRAYL